MQFLEKIWKMWENIEIKLATTGRRRNYLVSEPNYHTTKLFTEHLLEIEIKAEILINKPIYLGLSILELNKVSMYEFCYCCVKPKYDEKAKLCYIDTDISLHILQTFQCIHKNRWYLPRYCSRCWNKIWHFKLWIRM